MVRLYYVILGYVWDMLGYGMIRQVLLGSGVGYVRLVSATLGCVAVYEDDVHRHSLQWDRVRCRSVT